jgi:hypothetical protein
MKPTIEELKKMVVPEAMRAIGAKDLDDFYFYLKHGCFPNREKWRDDGENPDSLATVHTVVTVARDFVEVNDHYALVICHVKAWPEANGFMPRLYWTRLLYIQAEREGWNLRWDQNGNLFVTECNKPEWQSNINALKSLKSKGNGESFPMKFHVDAYQVALDAGRKWLAEARQKDIEEWDKQMKLQEEWREKDASPAL